MVRRKAADMMKGKHASPPELTLRKLYIEPTNRCNLNCRTCIRNDWNEAAGTMSEAVFDRIIGGLSSFTPGPTVFFGGFGEPLSHPDIVGMIKRAKDQGSRVEMISNGTLLTTDMSRKLIAAGLDLLWISIDGASAESYADIRLGAELPGVVENVKAFFGILESQFAVNTCGAVPLAVTEIGIAFVAMKRNIADLPAVMEIARGIGAAHFLVTNLLPYTAGMCDEILYNKTLSLALNPEPRPVLRIPMMDITETTRGPLVSALNYGRSIRVSGYNLDAAKNRCQFIEDGVGAFGWNGDFSPCLPLMHDHDSYYQERKRRSRRWVIGNIRDTCLKDLWNSGEHLAFRKKVHEFDFAPCVYCGGCDLADENEEDCEGNVFPTCGGCLWAQGVIQCP